MPQSPLSAFRLHHSAFLLLLLLPACTTPIQKPSPLTGLNWGDQGDGTYKNPILNCDFSDPDVIRVDDTFYLIASDFHFVGMQILQSKDLVNWTIAGQIFPKLTMDPKYDQMRGYGQGTWAPSLRYHNGEFYIYVCTPRDGLFMWHAKNPTGPWSDTVTVKKVPFWEDPCPFWDDDGQAYLVHSKKGAGPLIIHKMSPDGTTLLDDGKQVYFHKGAEGPKFYKRHGYYYLSFPEGGVSDGWQNVIRAKNIYGPYERREVLVKGSPHQGGIVELSSGESWFIGFKSVGWLGRVTNLEPVTWGSDDWPVFGYAGKHVLTANKPNIGTSTSPTRPELNDNFHETALSPLWQWNHNPINEDWSLTAQPGALRLNASPARYLALARNTLTQKLWDYYGIIDVQLSTKNFVDGDRAGITFISGDEFGWIGVEQRDGVRRIVSQMGPPPAVKRPSTPGLRRTRVPARKPAPPTTQSASPLPPPPKTPVLPGPIVPDTITLRAIYNRDGTLTFAFSADNKNFTQIPGKTTLRFLDWKGSRIGLFCYGPRPGAADFLSFRYRYFSTNQDLISHLDR